MPAPVRWFGQTLLWMVILGFVAVLAVGVLIPRMAGATPYTILTGSMAPSYPPGTLVVDKAADPDSVGVGTVITYQLESGKSAVVTHRVIAVSTSTDGERTFVTQGDANSVPDEEPVRAEQVRGQVWYAVPHLGRFSNAISGHQRQLAVYGVAGALVLYAGAMFAGAGRDRRRNGR
ncbi:MAG: signal peptidase [Nocardioides sp.]|nr:signal peptidase [Nocardioides sp.]